MLTNLNLSPLNNQPLLMTKRNLYTYKFVGLIQSKSQRTNPKHPQYFYQLNVLCRNAPTLQKIFVFQPKLKNETIWNTLETNAYLGQKYLFHCRNYRGSYYLVDWEEYE
jgi:hypothetical protein